MVFERGKGANKHSLSAIEIAMKLSDLETLPEVVTKAITVLNDGRSSIHDIAQVISLDQGITAMVLANANSVYFGTPRRFVTVKEAVIRLGYKNVLSVLYAASASSALSKPVTLYGMGHDELWKHSIVCAAGSRIIAQDHRLWDPEEAYVAGLLHDIGLPALEKFVRRESDLVRLIRSSDYPPNTAEQLVLGFDHAHLGGLICQKWQLSRDVVAAISAHHEPLTCDESVALASIVHVADVVSLLPEIGTCSPLFNPRVAYGVTDSLGLSSWEIDQLVQQLRIYLEESESFIME